MPCVACVCVCVSACVYVCFIPSHTQMKIYEIFELEDPIKYTVLQKSSFPELFPQDSSI